MSKDWFNGAVSKRLQTAGNILPRMALTMVQPDHVDTLLDSCHYKTSRELRRMHDEDRLTSDHSIVLIGLKSGTVCHSIITYKDQVAYDSFNDSDWGNWDAADDMYYTKQGAMIVNARISVDDFFKDYVAKVSLPIPRDPAHYREPK